MSSLLHEKILKDFEDIPDLRTRDLDSYNKNLIKARTDVSSLREYVNRYPVLHRTYFQVSLLKKDDYQDQFLFIEDNLELLNDWWHVDQLTQFLYKPIDFMFAYKLARKYLDTTNVFTRRWGYVLFITGLQREESHLEPIWSLLKDDGEYYVQMAQAWLICELVVYHPQKSLQLLEQSKLQYNILGKAIQKIQDSFRVDTQIKDYAKSLRPKSKNN